jgi:hypothetical protein
MAEHKQPLQQAALQHLAHLHQDSVPRQEASVLQPQYQTAVLAVQDLEHQRLQPRHLAVNQLDQFKVSQNDNNYKGK